MRLNETILHWLLSHYVEVRERTKMSGFLTEWNTPQYICAEEDNFYVLYNVCVVIPTIYLMFYI